MFYAVMVILLASVGYDVVDGRGPYADIEVCQERLIELRTDVAVALGYYHIKEADCKTKQDWIDALGRDPFKE